MDENLYEILTWSLVLIILGCLLQVIYNVGILDPIIITHTDIPTLLVATQKSQAPFRPEVTPEMAEVAMHVAKRGVHEEEAASPGHPARGYLYGEFPDALTTKSFTSPASPASEHGVVLEVGEVRATVSEQQSWQKWFVTSLSSPSAAVSSDVVVQIVPASPAIIVTTDERTGTVARAVARWRLLRRLERRAREHKLRSPVVVALFLSPGKRQISFFLSGIANPVRPDTSMSTDTSHS